MKKTFFNVISVQACQNILETFPQLDFVEDDFKNILTCYLAEDLYASEDLPKLARSSMDGYAVKAQDVFGASESNPAYLEEVANIAIAQVPDFTLQSGECASIVTGGYLPLGADAVVMVEHTQNMGAGTIEIRRSLAPNDNIMLQGEDAKKGECILKQGTLLRPQELGFMAALGLMKAKVYKKPKVGILSTGDELVAAGQPLKVGQIRDVNSPALVALVNSIGAEAKELGIVPDNLNSLRSAVLDNLNSHDVLILSGGSSVGTHDYTVELLAGLPNSEILVQGVAMSPGKPLIVAKIVTSKGVKAIIGLPGQITSAQVVMHILILPFLRHLSGDLKAFKAENRLTRKAILARNVASRQGREDYVRVRFEQDSNALLAYPLQGKSGLVKTLVEAQGLLRIPAELEGFEQGSEHDIILL
ncbi:gephyrin-like molybdotransferase Glp [Desulfovibrio litoralis]|uniref:Molybdopterin molybdenumtransferase n=2 Tax=Desulfovibrio litoralis DSM 11393 TaxID=1121455 RepID=A0A1M7S625_9BACT|nr:gephyrin-like molybdotransferase Glp [Desulfovibrio litoralis]SHN53795.1 molybdopterin molybdotransferase [Desulfovibrio litoralis DSM 11393]